MDEKKSEGEGVESERSGLLERFVKKGIESGIGAISRSEDTVRSFVEKTRLPKEVAHALLDQVDETKKGLYSVVAKEIRDFLTSTSFASDMKKVLTGLAFEVKMEVRFKSVEDENGEGGVRPDVQARTRIKSTKKPSAGSDDGGGAA
jgi:type II secretory pathway component PulJ